MRPKSLLLLALALGCGLVASIGISQVMERNSKPHATLETTPIYVAKHNINLGDPIDASMLSLQEWPKDKVPHGAISKLEDLDGRRPRSAIIEGEAILEAKLLAPGQIADPIRSIQAGMRLKTIAVDAEKSAAGLLGPGDRVDVQLFVKADARNNILQAQSRVILQNIRVFAVDATVQRSPDGSEEKTIAKTVSLMLTPEQATKLTLAENLGVVSLIPRNPDDESISDLGTLKSDDLWDKTERNSRAKEQGVEDVAADEPKVDHGALATVVAATTPPPAPPFTMEVIEREAMRVVSFDRATGRPMHDAATPTTTAGPTVGTPASTGAAAHGSAPADPKKMLDNFPINFDANNN